MYITESIFGYLQITTQNLEQSPAANLWRSLIKSSSNKFCKTFASRLSDTHAVGHFVLNRSLWLLCWPTPFGCMMRGKASRHLLQLQQHCHQ